MSTQHYETISRSGIISFDGRDAYPLFDHILNIHIFEVVRASRPHKRYHRKVLTVRDCMGSSPLSELDAWPAAVLATTRVRSADTHH